MIDIGAGTTDIAVISLSGVVESESSKVAGEAFNDAIVKYIRKKHNVLIGDTTAEEIKKSIGCVFPRPETNYMEVKGRCLMTGLPRMISISSSEMIEAFEEVSEQILEAVHQMLESIPPELVADISDNGIVLTAAAASSGDGQDLLRAARASPRIADDAEMCVAYGINKSLDWVNDMQDGPINIARRKQMRQ